MYKATYVLAFTITLMNPSLYCFLDGHEFLARKEGTRMLQLHEEEVSHDIYSIRF